MRQPVRIAVCMSAVIALMLLVAAPASALEVFSAGMRVPETISQIPNAEGWNGLLFSPFGQVPDIDGDFLVPDPSQDELSGTVWHVPRAGGPANAFWTPGSPETPYWLWTPGFATLGGVFLPWPIYLSVERFIPPQNPEDPPMWFYQQIPIWNSYVATGWEMAEPTNTPRIAVYQPIVEPLVQEIETEPGSRIIGIEEFTPPIGASNLTTPIIAPAQFGAYGGALMITDQNKGVWAYPAGSTSSALLFFDSEWYQATTGTPFRPFGAVFAPAGFGDVGGRLLVSDADSQDDGKVSILSIGTDERGRKFMDLPLTPEQLAIKAGLRQMAFFPDGFGDLSGLLVLSVSGSYRGGGVLGQLLAINEEGQVVKILKLGSEVDKFDPRGLLFLDDGRLLISDASDAILVATAADFVVIPEPPAVLLLAIAAASLVALRRLRGRHEHPET